jgi:hypothetical protein
MAAVYPASMLFGGGSIGGRLSSWCPSFVSSSVKVVVTSQFSSLLKEMQSKGVCVIL